MPVGEWTHVAVVFDRYKGPTLGSIQFYINGELDSTADDQTQLPDNTTNCTIGALYDTVGGTNINGPFKGHLADLRVQSRCFGANEIKELYNSGNGTYNEQDYINMSSTTTLDINGSSVAFWMKTENDYYTNLWSYEFNATSGRLS